MNDQAIHRSWTLHCPRSWISPTGVVSNGSDAMSSDRSAEPLVHEPIVRGLLAVQYIPEPCLHLVLVGLLQIGTSSKVVNPRQ